MTYPTAVAERSLLLARRTSVVVPVLVFVAFLARLLPVLRGGGLRGILAYDDGVYFGAADALLSGRLPYRDFVFLHPPGVLIVLAPFAALGRLTSDPIGFAAARVAFMAVGALNAALVYYVARRAGRVAAISAGGMYALWGPAVYAERTTLLEPLVNLGLLSALALLGDVRVTPRRRLLLAGAVLGAATAVKLWAVVPLIVLAIWVLLRRGRSAGATFVSASAFTAALVSLPFFVNAPARMVRLVVLDQLGRPNNGVSTLHRISGIVDYYHPGGGGSFTHMVVLAVTTSTVVAIAAAVVAVTAPQLRVWVALLVVQTALLLLGPVYYAHYATFIAPALCLVSGAAIAFVVARIDVQWWWRPLPVFALSCVALALLVIFGPVVREGRPVPAGAVAEVVEHARCVRADSTAALITTDLLSRDLRRGCPLAVDVTGVTYDLDPAQLHNGSPYSARRADPAWQRFLTSYVTGAEAYIVVQAPADGFGPQVRAILNSQRVLLRAGHLTVYRITGRG
jgi:hypothetical protein